MLMTQKHQNQPFIHGETVLFEHCGPVTKEILLDALPMLEQVLESRGINRQAIRKVVNVAIECLQNLQLHGSDETKPGIDPEFYVVQDEDSISIITRNLINPNDKEQLRDRIIKINSLNEEEIKFLYTVIMRQTVVKFSSKGGAGLGLVDMRKKSGAKLDFAFQDMNGSGTVFNLKVSVPIH